MHYWQMNRPSLSAVAELLEPITWFPLMWAFACGVVASGVALQEQWLLVAISGPLFVAGMMVSPFALRQVRSA